MKFYDNHGGKHDTLLKAFMSNIRHNKNRNNMDNKERCYKTSVSTKLSTCKKIEIDYENNEILLKNDNGDVVVRSEIDQQLKDLNNIQLDSSIGLIHMISNDAYSINTVSDVNKFEREASKLISECIDNCNPEIVKLLSSNYDSDETAIRFNQKYAELQAKLLSTAIDKDIMIVKYGGEPFIKKMFTSLMDVINVAFHAK